MTNPEPTTVRRESLSTDSHTQPVVTMHIDALDLMVLQDHKVKGVPILPGAMLVALFLQEHNEQSIRLKDLSFEAMIPLSDRSPLSIQCVQKPDDRIEFWDESGRSIYASMVLSNSSIEPTANAKAFATQSVCQRASGSQLYSKLATNGNDYGPAFRTIADLGTAPAVAKANWNVANEVSSPSCKLAILLDACTHVCAHLANLSTTYLLKSIGEIEVFSTDIPDVASISAKLLESDLPGCSAAVEICAPSGDVIARLNKVTLALLSEPSGPEHHVAVAGTFTLDPITRYANTWNDQLGLNLGIQPADYSQVFQELLGDTGALNEQAAAHVALIRLEDWAQRQQHASKRDNGVQASDFGDLATHQLSNGCVIAHLNEYETKYLDKEIFSDLAYRRHGIGIVDNDTVIDIGANIGMFSLFASEQAKHVKIVAIEPSPYVLPMLKANLAAHTANSVVVPAGASGKRGKAEFTAYPKSSVFSTFSSDKPADLDALSAIVRNTLIASGHDDEAFVDATVAEMLADRMQTETYDVDLVCVSDLIRELGIEQIGLLKIDAEKSEHAILAGIEDEHWPLIQQLIIEVHTQDGSDVKTVETLLTEHGFEFVLDEEKLLADSGLVTLYASRPDRKKQVLGEQNAFIEESIDLYVDAASAHAQRSKLPLLTVLCPSTSNDPLLKNLLTEYQIKLMARLSSLSNNDVLEWHELTKQYPVDTIGNRVGNELGHIPYSQDWYAATATALLRRCHASRRQPFKVIALDCDNTLWKGVVGEVGPTNIAFEKGHLALHRFVKARVAEGMVVCLVSKNSVEDVADVFNMHTQLALSWEDFVSHRINWNPKSSNLREIAAELNLGLDSFIFLDDSPVECAEVRSALPEVLTLQMPADPEENLPFLNNVWAFDSTTNTDEDRQRATRYRDESNRKQFLREASSIKSFIEGLQLDVNIAPVSSEQLERAAQMTNRTNQFNLTTKRRSVSELSHLISDGYECSVVRVGDRFGDYGLTGLTITRSTENQLLVDTMLLSCRVLGRGVEHQIIAKLGEIATAAGLSEVVLPYEPTAKNEPARRFLESISETALKAGNAEKIAIPATDASQIVYVPQANNGSENQSSESDSSVEASQAVVRSIDSIAIESAAYSLQSVQAIVEKSMARTKQPRPDISSAFVAPNTALEKTIAAIWCDILGLVEVGLDDSFFDIGGSSLAAVEMVVMLHEKESLASKLAVVDVFDSPTVRALAQVLSGTGSKPRVEASKDRGAARRNRAIPRRGRNRH